MLLQGENLKAARILRQLPTAQRKLLMLQMDRGIMARHIQVGIMARHIQVGIAIEHMAQMMRVNLMPPLASDPGCRGHYGLLGGCA